MNEALHRQEDGSFNIMGPWTKCMRVLEETYILIGKNHNCHRRSVSN